MKLFIFFILIVIGHSQPIKIGNITLSNCEAKEYLLDCYLNPDSILEQGIYFTGSEYEKATRKAIEYTTNSNGEDVMLVPRTPSEYDYMLFINRKNGKAKLESSKCLNIYK